MGQHVTVWLWLDGAWVPAPHYASRPVTITRGMDPGAQWPRPSKIDVELDNDDLSMDPSRADSPLYGRAGRNTRVRVTWTEGATHYIRMVAEASSWRPHRTMEHRPGQKFGRAGTDLTAEGLLRRIGTWTEPLRSPLHRTISAKPELIGHWPMEEGRGATSLANTLTNGRPARITGTEGAAGDDDAPLGAAASYVIGEDTVLSGTFAEASPITGWQLAWAMKLDQLPAVTGELLGFTTTNGYSWWVFWNGGSYQLLAYDADDALQLNISGAAGVAADPRQWIMFAITASISGSTVSVDLEWYPQGNTAALPAPSGSYTGSIGALVGWTFTAVPGITDGGRLSHLHAVTGVPPAVPPILGIVAERSFDGYKGETSWDRFIRLSAELDLQIYAYGAEADTQAMGVQRPNTALQLFREIVDTEDALIYDEPADVALTLRTRRHQVAQTPKLALTYGVNVAGYAKVLDDLTTGNAVTVANADGGESTAVQTTGPLSILPPPDGAGEVRRLVDVSVADPGVQLPPLAGWHLIKGTIDRPRYEMIAVDVLANPELIIACQTVRPGDLITVDDLEPDQLRLRVTGSVERTGVTTRVFEFATEPYDAWDAARYDAPASRYDVRGSTLQTARTAGQTAWTVAAATRDDLWSTTATPYTWIVAGEQVTVTAMGAAVGTGPYTQAATVVRAVNTISKAQAAGTEIHLAHRVRYAL